MAIVNSSSATVELINQDKFDSWSSIRSSTAKDDNGVDPYVHPMLRRSASFMSQASLDSCTESLGAETGWDRFEDLDDFDYYSSDDSEDEEKEEEFEMESIVGMFPPPISSIRHREMIARRSDGRLVLESVAVASRKNSLCCQRQDGRLLLRFVNDFVANGDVEFEKEAEREEDDAEEEEDDEEEEEEEEEEVEVVDKGTIVVKVETHRSTSFGINKFVGVEDKIPPEVNIDGLKRVSPQIMRADLGLPNLMTPKKLYVKKRGAILEHMKKRCNLELKRPLFKLEPRYVAAAAT